jgi:hypothetical protein
MLDSARLLSAFFVRNTVSFVTDYLVEVLALQSQIDLPDGDCSETKGFLWLGGM